MLLLVFEEAKEQLIYYVEQKSVLRDARRIQVLVSLRLSMKLFPLVMSVASM